MNLSAQAGVSGSLAVRGSIAFAGCGPGVWRVDLENLGGGSVFQYGNTTGLVYPIPAVYDILSTSGETITKVAIDPTTGFLGVAHGPLLDIIDTGKHVLESTFSNVSDPALPTNPVALSGFTFEAPDVT